MDQPEQDATPAIEPAKKVWIEPELAVFLMSEAEAPVKSPSGSDFGSNHS